MDTDIRDEIDRSFGDGPSVDDTTLLLGRGHRALRRRRLAEGATGLVVAAVAITVAVVATSGQSDDAVSPAAPPSSSPTASADSQKAGTPDTVTSTREPEGTLVDGVMVVVDRRLSRGTDVELDLDGSVHTGPGVTIDRAISNPYDRTPPSRSAAVVYTAGGETYWYAGYVDPGGGASASQSAQDTGGSFRDWVDEQAPIRGSGGTSGHPGTDGSWPGRPDLKLVLFVGDTERLRPASDVTILEQRPHPAVPDSFATAADRSAVAEIQVDGERWYVLARQTADGAPPEFIYVAAEDGGASLDDFLDLARERYADGGGGLL